MYAASVRSGCARGYLAATKQNDAAVERLSAVWGSLPHLVVCVCVRGCYNARTVINRWHVLRTLPLSRFVKDTECAASVCQLLFVRHLGKRSRAL